MYDELMEDDLLDYQKILVKQLRFNENILRYNFLYTLLPFIVLMMVLKFFGDRINTKILSVFTSIYIGLVLIVLIAFKVRSIYLKKKMKEVDFLLEDDDF